MSFGMRIFGNELQYHNYDGKERVNSFFDMINPKTRFRNLLNEKVSYHIKIYHLIINANRKSTMKNRQCFWTRCTWCRLESDCRSILTPSVRRRSISKRPAPLKHPNSWTPVNWTSRAQSNPGACPFNCIKYPKLRHEISALWLK
jgi:hypothetical protein